MSEELQLHALCEVFPEITGAEFDALVADIKANGQRETIKLYEGQVIDGRNRYRACLAAGIEPKFEGISIDGDIASYVLSLNLHRRHMTAAQAAAVVAAITDWSKANTRGGRRSTDEIPEIPLTTVADRAKASGTSERTQRTADTIAKQAPELLTEVAKGTLSLAGAVAKINEGKPKSERQIEAEKAAEDAHGDVDIVSELEAMHKRVTELQALLDQVHSDSPQGKILGLNRMLDAANKERDRQMEIAADFKKKAKWGESQLTRIGRIIGETDMAKIADAVELALKKAA